MTTPTAAPVRRCPQDFCGGRLLKLPDEQFPGKSWSCALCSRPAPGTPEEESAALALAEADRALMRQLRDEPHPGGRKRRQPRGYVAAARKAG